MTALLLLFFLMCAGWICFFVAEAAYSDLRVERDLLLAAMRADEKVGEAA